MSNPALVDVPVLCIFFARPQQFSKVFEQVKKARPTKLFLYQDGARRGNTTDAENIEKCRNIAEDIDWDCEVFRLYQPENVGCDPSEFLAIKWAFEHVDRCIILEDDDVPSQSFFPFCKEMLEKYYDDQRINMICGLNLLEESKNNPYSYLFTKSGSIWGWATWKRNVDLWEEHLEFLDDEHAYNLYKETFPNKKDHKFFMNTFEKHRQSGRAHYESILGSSRILYNRLNIVPTKNLISNIGISGDTTHSVNDINKQPKGIRRVFFMKTFELEFPLKHPKYIMEDVKYKDDVDRIIGYGHPFIRFYRRCDSVVRRILHGDFKIILKKFIKRIKK